MQSTGPSAFEWWTFAIAIAGFMLGAIGFGWRIFGWRRSGAQVQVLLKGGWRFPDNGVQPVPIESFDITDPPRGAKPLLLVEVANRGRGPTEVSEWWVRVGDAVCGMTHSADPVAIEALIQAGMADAVMAKFDDILLEGHNERCPCVLNGGSRKTWAIDASKVAEHVGKFLAGGKPVALGAVVNYGGGSSADSGQQISPASIGMR